MSTDSWSVAPQATCWATFLLSLGPWAFGLSYLLLGWTLQQLDPLRGCLAPACAEARAAELAALLHRVAATWTVAALLSIPIVFATTGSRCWIAVSTLLIGMTGSLAIVGFDLGGYLELYLD